MLEVSTNYRKLELSEVEALNVDSAWQSPEIPELQYELCVKAELRAWQRGEDVAPFRVLTELCRLLPASAWPDASVLEVGASSGFNREVLRRSWDRFRYTAIDFSTSYQVFASTLWPDITFDVGDARSLPYSCGAFDIVLSGAVLLHIREFERVIAETSRVASKYAIFHRTPVWGEPIAYYLKEGYGVPMLEIHFNESDLISLFEKYGLPIVADIDVASPSEDGLVTKSYLCKKGLFHHSV